MMRKVGRFTIEHWRDGECFEKVELRRSMIQRLPDGVGRIVFSPGLIELATGDELRFDCDGLLELLQ